MKVPDNFTKDMLNGIDLDEYNDKLLNRLEQPICAHDNINTLVSINRMSRKNRVNCYNIDCRECIFNNKETLNKYLNEHTD